MDSQRHRYRPYSVALTLLSILIFAVPGYTQYVQDGLHTADSPDFPTDLGVHLGFGGNSCLGGGSGYASCNDVNHAWDTNVGFNGGIIIRPYPKFSFGIDASYTRMTFHQYTEDSWGDYTIGPTVRGHMPMYLSGVFIEPNLGLQLGYIRGIYLQTKRKSENDYRHKHSGLFFAASFGTDIFIPRTTFGIGFEVRLMRTMYREVCFEWSEGNNCRGVSDENIVRTYDIDFDEDNKIEVVKNGDKFPGEKGIATYPWKVYYGAHIVYYF